MGVYINKAELLKELSVIQDRPVRSAMQIIKILPTIDLVRCKDCKHRPIKDDPDRANYGFNIIEPTDGDDICPCLVDDGWYSWMPEDNFYCGRGERRAD